MLAESSWGMRLDTISLSSSASAANSFNFWSKVGFFVSIFLTCASRIRPSLPRCCGCWTLSKPPLFFHAVFDKFLTRFWAASPFRAILLLLLPSLGFSWSYWRGWFCLCHSAQSFRLHPRAKESYPFRGSSPSAGITVTYTVAIAFAVAVDVLGTGSVVIFIFVVWTLWGFWQQRFAFVPRWSFFLVVFGIVDLGVFAVVYTNVLPVILTTFVVFVSGVAIFYWS